MHGIFAVSTVQENWEESRKETQDSSIMIFVPSPGPSEVWHQELFAHRKNEINSWGSFLNFTQVIIQIFKRFREF